MKIVSDSRACYEVQKICDLRIHGGDAMGVGTLSADVFLPVGPGKVACIITVLPYRKDAGIGVMLEQTLQWFAAHGFAAVLVDFKGTGSSDGKQRPPFDQDEAEDGISAIEWAVNQPWCNGSVGMWGMSYGAIMAMRVATKGPKNLRAIIPIMGMTDPELDFVHPQGARGCLAPLAFWGVHTLLDQLLPPIAQFHVRDEQRRWTERLNESDPWLLDLWRRMPGDPVWRQRAFDVSKITIPTLCICGWRDIFCDPSIRAFERIAATKKLVVGPWMHTLPDQSPFWPWDYRRLALRWWDRWLNDVHNDVENERQADIFIQGAKAHWRSFDKWWPDGATVNISGIPRVGVGGGRESSCDSCCDPRGGKEPGAQFLQDQTVGPLGGLCGSATSGFGLPQDQHDEDELCTTFTSNVSTEDMLIAGRPTIVIHWSKVCAPSRLLVRLTDVTSSGASTLVTMGVLVRPPASVTHEVVLGATCYEVPRGHMLRVTVSDADFPRLWPVVNGMSNDTVVVGFDVRVPVIDENEGCPVEMPDLKGRTEIVEGLAFDSRPIWKIERDLIYDGVKVMVGDGYSAVSPSHTCLLQADYNISSSITSSGRFALVESRATATAKLETGEEVRVAVRAVFRSEELRAEGIITVNDIEMFRREWRG